MHSIQDSCKRWIANFLSLFTQAKSFRDNPIIGNALLNRLGLHTLRVLLAHGIFCLRQSMLFFLIDATEREQLRKQGYLLVPNVLNEAQLEDLQQAFYQADIKLHSSRQGNTLTHSRLLTPQLQAQLTNIHSIIDCPAILNRLRYASAMMLSPWFYFLRIENSHQTEQDPQKKPHADAFHPTMKAWLFLHEVTLEHGPFCYYPGSHKLSLKRLRWEYQQSLTARSSSDLYTARGSFRVSDKDRIQLGLGQEKVFTVPANTLVIANTYGFHFRGQAPDGAIRDSLWASSWRAPFLPIPFPDSQSLRAFFYKKMQQHL